MSKHDALNSVLLGTDIYNGLELSVIGGQAAFNRLLYGKVLDTSIRPAQRVLTFVDAGSACS